MGHLLLIERQSYNDALLLSPKSLTTGQKTSKNKFVVTTNEHHEIDPQHDKQLKSYNSLGFSIFMSAFVFMELSYVVIIDGRATAILSSRPK